MQPLLGHPHRDRRQLSDLTPSTARPHRHARSRRTRARTTGTAAANAQRSRRPAPAEAAGGTDPRAPAAHRASAPIPSPRPRRRRRRILRRRQRRVTRTPIQTTLKLDHPSLEPLVRRHQPSFARPLIEPKQQPIAVSRSPSRIASASARSTPTHSPPAGSLHHLNAYAFFVLPLRLVSGLFGRLVSGLASRALRGAPECAAAPPGTHWLGRDR